HEFHLLGRVHARHTYETLLHRLHVLLVRLAQLVAHAALGSVARIDPPRAVVAVLIVDVRGFFGRGGRTGSQLSRGLTGGTACRTAGLEAFDEARVDLRIQLEHVVVELGRRTARRSLAGCGPSRVS